ncbi:MAG: hypothetical protein ABI572_11905 [Actinomycetota bacterium]
MSVLTRDVLGSTARAMPWLPPVAASVVATAVVARLDDGGALPLQVAAVVLASGLGYALDDPAFEIIGSSPVSLWQRRQHRLVLVLPPTVLLFFALLVWHGTADRSEALALGAMFAGLVGLALGIAGTAARRSPRGLGGIAVAPTLFATLIMSTLFAPRWRPLPIGDIPGGWPAIIARWSAAAVIGLAVLAISSRDRAARGSGWRPDPRSPTSPPRRDDHGAAHPRGRRRAASAR